MIVLDSSITREDTLSTELQIENTCRALRHLHTLNTQSEEGGVYLTSLILIHYQSLVLQNWFNPSFLISSLSEVWQQQVGISNHNWRNEEKHVNKEMW